MFAHSKNPSVLYDALDGLICLTKAATAWRLQGIVDTVVANLCEVVLTVKPTVVRGGVGNGSRRFVTKLDAYKVTEPCKRHILLHVKDTSFICTYFLFFPFPRLLYTTAISW